LQATYSRSKLQGKAVNKRALQERFGLEADPNVPLLGIVSRLTRQKGIDLVLAIADELLSQSVQLIVLGSGDKSFEAELRQLQQEQPETVGVHLGYNEKLAHLVEAGADIFLMPSRFEPCGLNQMYSMLYGTPPVVRRTGGLADSVIDATPRTLADGTATGFVFTGDNEAELLACVLRALTLFQQKTAWRKLQISGMKQDLGWHCSAQQYLSLYRSLITGG
jgi:starch synthase